MEKRFVHKVPGGKLLKVRLDYASGVINSLRINGDFFAHPEDAIERLESMLSGRALSEIDSIINDFVKTGVVLYGIAASDIAYAIREASK